MSNDKPANWVALQTSNCNIRRGAKFFFGDFSFSINSTLYLRLILPWLLYSLRFARLALFPLRNPLHCPYCHIITHNWCKFVIYCEIDCIDLSYVLIFRWYPYCNLVGLVALGLAINYSEPNFRVGDATNGNISLTLY